MGFIKIDHGNQNVVDYLYVIPAEYDRNPGKEGRGDFVSIWSMEKQNTPGQPDYKFQDKGAFMMTMFAVVMGRQFDKIYPLWNGVDYEKTFMTKVIPGANFFNIMARSCKDSICYDSVLFGIKPSKPDWTEFDMTLPHFQSFEANVLATFEGTHDPRKYKVATLARPQKGISHEAQDLEINSQISIYQYDHSHKEFLKLTSTFIKDVF